MATIRVSAKARVGRVRPEIFGTMIENWGDVDRHAIYGSVWVGEDAPVPHVRGLRQDVLEATQELAPTVIRWPGGCPADVYHWKDGVGPRAERPHTLLPMQWSRGLVETNAFGTAEFIDFCREVGAAPYINANVGTGTPEEAAQWVEYCNRTGGTRYAALRAQHGFAEPFNVPFWGIGNELYGRWEIGHMDASAHARIAHEYAKLIHMVDTQVRIVAVGCHRDEWNYPLLKTAGEDIDDISIHKYYQYEDYDTLVACPVQAERTFSRLAALLDALNPRQGKGAPGSEVRTLGGRWPLIAVDEWNVWHEEAGRLAFYQKLTLQDGIFTAGMFHAFHRMCNYIGMANLCDLVNSGPCGPIVANEAGIYVNPQYLAFHMYRYHTGDLVLNAEVVDCGTYDAGEIHALGEKAPDRIDEAPYLDCLATFAETRQTLYLAVINRHASEDIECAIDLNGFRVSGRGMIYELNGEDVLAANDFDCRTNVRIVERRLDSATAEMGYVFPRHSVTILELAATSG